MERLSSLKCFSIDSIDACIYICWHFRKREENTHKILKLKVENTLTNLCARTSDVSLGKKKRDHSEVRGILGHFICGNFTQLPAFFGALLPWPIKQETLGHGLGNSMGRKSPRTPPTLSWPVNYLHQTFFWPVRMAINFVFSSHVSFCFSSAKHR